MSVRRIDTRADQSKFVGYINKGGALSTKGMLYTNQCSRFHIIKEIASLFDLPLPTILWEKFIKMQNNEGDPNS